MASYSGSASERLAFVREQIEKCAVQEYSSGGRHVKRGALEFWGQKEREILQELAREEAGGGMCSLATQV